MASAEAAFLKQLHNMAHNAAQVQALLGKELPKNISSWQVALDAQGLRREARSLAHTLKQQKEVGRAASGAVGLH